jgi:dipeptidyl aminopeptidase/acylaminoacyl peptidase
VLASPTHYVAENAPPMLLVHGAEDAKVPESQSIELYNDLAAAGDEAMLVPVQNMGHMFVQVGSKSLDPSLEQVGKDIVDFFNRYAGGS